eukprot:8266580-Karenia_brevis.AAC.1
MLSKKWWGRRTIQVVGGHWTHAFQFRRCASCFLSEFWTGLKEALSEGAIHYRSDVSRELLAVVILTPLLVFDLRTPLSSRIT